jgi:hypothetical protein
VNVSIRINNLDVPGIKTDEMRQLKQRSQSLIESEFHEHMFHKLLSSELVWNREMVMPVRK